MSASRILMSAFWNRRRVSADRRRSRSASSKAGVTALGIEAQPQPHEVQLEQLGRDLGGLVAVADAGTDSRTAFASSRCRMARNGDDSSARDVRRQQQQLDVARDAPEARLDDPERHQRIGAVGGGPAQQLDARQEPAREPQVVARLAAGLGGRLQHRAQLGIVARLLRQLGRPLAAARAISPQCRYSVATLTTARCISSPCASSRSPSALRDDSPPPRGLRSTDTNFRCRSA